ncbi:tetratricopeptide repeat protein [Kiloniella litopenaei]|nr:tetratricopeptide repeat protein [Kiloniella litopenaei]
MINFRKLMTRLFICVGALLLFSCQTVSNSSAVSDKANELQLLCNNEDLGACVDLGILYLGGEEPKPDGKKALTSFSKACNGGQGFGCYNIGLMYSQGLGVRKYPAKAFIYFKEACSLEVPFSCYAAAATYPKNDDFSPNHLKVVEYIKKEQELRRKPVEYYEQKCADGVRWSCFHLANKYKQGIGVKKDELKSVEIFEILCREGELLGCYKLGLSYAEGRGVEHDYTKAFSLYQRACDGGLAAGCNNLGWMYAQGLTVPVDEDKAYVLYQKSCRGDFSLACEKVKEIKKRKKQKVF